MITGKDVLGLMGASQNNEILSRREVEADIFVGAFATMTGTTTARGMKPITDSATQSIDGLLLRDSNKETVVVDGIVKADAINNYGDFITKGTVTARAGAEFTPAAIGKKIKIDNNGFVVPGDAAEGTEINAYAKTTCEAPGAGDLAFQAVEIEILGL